MLKDLEIYTKPWQSSVVEFEKHQFEAGQLEGDEHLEDITDLLFTTAQELKPGQTICREGFDLADTMNGFELMDPKMDSKADKETLFTPQKARDQGLIRDEYSDGEILAILDQFLIQEARWLKGNSTISTIYSFILLVDKDLYQNNEILNAYIQYLTFFEYHSLDLIRTCTSVRDDEFTFPSLHEINYSVANLHELLELLNAVSAKLADTKDSVKANIASHLQLRHNIIKAFMLMFRGADALSKDKNEDEKKEEEEKIETGKSKNKKKNKKKKNKKKQVEKEIDPLKESSKLLTEASEEILPLLTGQLTSDEEKEFAQKMFSESMKKSINMVIVLANNLSDMPFTQAHTIFSTMCRNIRDLTTLHEFRFIYEIVQFIEDKFTDLNEIPLPITRCLCEKILFPDPSSIVIFGTFELHKEFLKKQVCELFPSIWTHYDCKEYIDFMYKYSLMIREYLLKKLRNKVNQRKMQNRYYEDLMILVSEANFIDDFLIHKKKYQGKNVTPSLVISIKLVAETMFEHLRSGLPLELYAPYELSMIFNYMSYISNIIAQNSRRSILVGFCNDLFKNNLVSVEELDGDAYNKRRKKMTELQKKTCDEVVLFQALHEIYQAHCYFFLLAMKTGWIKNPLRGLFGTSKANNLVEKNAYRHRFHLFKHLNFPTYQEYEKYEEMYNKVFENETSEAVAEMRDHFMKGLGKLNTLKSTDESMRNKLALSDEQLEVVSRVCAMNSFAYFKGTNAGEGQRVKIKIDMTASYWVPGIDVELISV